MAETTVTVDPGRLDVIVTSTFKAPKDKIFKAYTDAELVPQWWGPAKYTSKIVKLDPTVGGEWEFHQNDGGDNHRFRGVFHDIVENTLIVQTFEYLELGEPGHVILEKVTFDEKDGVTTVKVIDTFLTQEDRDGMVASGMEGGLREGIDRLAKLVGENE